jgi:hypothetical protein
MSDTLTGTFTDSEKTDIRRFCGYEAFGTPASGFQSWRFFTEYGLLEYKMTNMSVAEQAQVRSKLNDLYLLETAIPAAADNLDTDKAAIWTHNKTEVAERKQLFNYWRKQLCEFIGVPPMGFLRSGGRNCIV